MTDLWNFYKFLIHYYNNTSTKIMVSFKYGLLHKDIVVENMLKEKQKMWRVYKLFI